MTRPGFGSTSPVLRCGRCGRFVDWENSRLNVVCGCRPHLDLPPVLVREASESDRREALALFRRHFGAGPLIVNGGAVSLEDAHALVAETDAEIAGALAWRPVTGGLHVLALATEPMWQRAGVGGHLLAEAEMLARQQNQSRVIASVTNDNLPALYFYQRRGYRLLAILPDSGAAKPRRPEAIGFGGIAIRDEVQLVKQVAN